MSEDYLIRNCAPTLAGIKTASLFTCPYEDPNALVAELRRINQQLRPKGLRILPLRFSGKKALIYLYRPRQLTADLSDKTAAQLLERSGYSTGGCEKCILLLVRKLRQQEEFPHEIGLFLGYPPEDVWGFMENRACKCVGCWKVYGDVDTAQRKFRQYKRCTRIYWDQWANGTNIERLTVAG